MSRFLCEKYNDLVPYVPGEQPKVMDLTKLNTNESPFSPSPMVRAVIDADTVSALNLYPNTDAAKTRSAVADYYGIGEDCVYVGNGSDEVLAHIFMTFFQCAKALLQPDISYGFYPVYSALFGIDSELIPLTDDYQIDIETFCDRRGNVIIANPNAPTGIALSREELLRIVVAHPDDIVVIDEAYVDFGAESMVGDIANYENMIVVQTLSKSRSLAGMRLGLMLANAALIADINRIKYSFNSYNVSRIADAVGAAAFGDKQYFEECCATIRANREYLVAGLRDMGFRVLPSSANFVMASPTGISAKEYFEALRKQKILVRYFAKDRLFDWVRITVGSLEQMKLLLEVTATLVAKGGK